jgi:3-hydroxybutyryl-CoA dehydratase
MTATLEALPKGHHFPATSFDLSSQWVSEYTAAVEDGAISALGDFVPPMAIAALSIRALLDHAGLPGGAIHLGQEIAFSRAVRPAERLAARAQIASCGERRGWVLMGVDLTVSDEAANPVMTGRGTVTFPSQPYVGDLDTPGAAAPAQLSLTRRSDGVSPITKSLTQEKINRYAEASGDRNPLHIDPAFAAKTRFGGTIAHGMLVLAYASEMLTLAFAQKWLSSGRLKVRFRGAARPGDTVTARGQIARSDGGTTTCEIECHNQNGEILISGTSEVTA